MSFGTNHSQQISLFDATANLTDREKRLLEKSWAKYFAENIFPGIDEAPFSVLYSDRPSRHNTPVNVIIGALILKEIFGLTDEEIVDTLPFDIRYQYALHTTSFEEQPLNDRTLGRFRARCNSYEEMTGIDLIHDCIIKLSSSMATMMKLNTGMRRMDSLMVASNIKKMSRLELLYTCVANLARLMKKLEDSTLPEGLLHYTEDNDHNSITVDYQYEKNTYSNSQFLKDYIEQQPDDGAHAILTTDGGYCGMENSLLAEEKNITLVTTDLKGSEVSDHWADFEFNEDGTKLLRCAAGHEPKSSVYDKNTQKCKASFPLATCKNCPYHSQCHPKEYKRVATIKIAIRTAFHARQQRFLKTKLFFGFKVAGMNARKLIRYLTGLVKVATYPEIA